jgi:mono/diheme cytochrome c family protein
MQGAKANLLAVVVDLHDAMNEKQMEDYETDLTEALANLALVNGRPSEDGALGGVTGALANTSLGVPAGAPTVSGCSVPTRAPAYGVVNGHLAYVALPRMSASPIPKEMSVSRVVVRGDAVVLYTRQTEIVDAICRAQARASTSPRAALKVAAHLQRTRDVRRVADVGTGAQVADAPAASSPALYTTQQAHAGQAVFTANCVGCHGANLLGVAAPGVAGTEFLTTVKNNKWTLADFRTLVVENMPLNNPGTLTPTQYANVIAYLLASNCYPAGTTAFPEKETPNLAKIKMGPVPGAKPSDEKTGICAVK